ncbi:hypothetical protein [Aureimonas sp. Leaf454]|uniref:hypothetical protein n=1 Tax=Aureimonas sp. Leaf454 TaxID=1736381 RepID=UPI000AC81E4D|nr:hypothetical protein [Aureimonas sp. Leaf454]
MADRTRGEIAAEARRLRAEEALKANLRRRKEQARARRADSASPETAAEGPEPGEANKA